MTFVILIYPTVIISVRFVILIYPTVIITVGYIRIKVTVNPNISHRYYIGGIH